VMERARARANGTGFHAGAIRTCLTLGLSPPLLSLAFIPERHLRRRAIAGCEISRELIPADPSTGMQCTFYVHDDNRGRCRGRSLSLSLVYSSTERPFRAHGPFDLIASELNTRSRGYLHETKETPLAVVAVRNDARPSRRVTVIEIPIIRL